MSVKVDFIGIGAEKSGTYWIANCLREHPEVGFAWKKELSFFNDLDQHFLKYRNPRYEWGIQWYEKAFPTTEGLIKGEFTPTYLYSERAAQRIKLHYPKVKLIVCLRDPVKRAFSQYLHDKSIGVIEDVPFEQIILHNSSYIEKGLYFKHLSNYLKYFNKENLLILFLDDLKKNPEKVVREIYKFVGIKNINFLPPSLYTQPNRASESRVGWINKMLVKIEYFLIKRRLDKVLKLLEDLRIRRKVFLFSYLINRKQLVKYPQISKATEIKLRKIFRNDVIELEKLVGRKLSSWKEVSDE